MFLVLSHYYYFFIFLFFRISRVRQLFDAPPFPSRRTTAALARELTKLGSPLASDSRGNTASVSGCGRWVSAASGLGGAQARCA
jgi:hypothetical protein